MSASNLTPVQVRTRAAIIVERLDSLERQRQEALQERFFLQESCPHEGKEVRREFTASGRDFMFWRCPDCGKEELASGQSEG